MVREAHVKSLSRQQVRAIDRYAIDVLGVPGVLLMENAGRNAAEAIEHYLVTARGHSVAVVAGGGNNGGDGFVIARHLVLRGAKVSVFLVAPPEKIAGDALVNLNIIRKLGLEIRTLAEADLDGLYLVLRRFDLIVDALGGTGVQGSLTGAIAKAVGQVNDSGTPAAAVDIPTGLDCDTGEIHGQTIRAAFTVTFVARKKGFDADEAAEYTGEVIVVDIGIPAAQVAQLIENAEAKG